MSRSVYESEMKRVIRASDFSQSHNDSLTYTDSQMQAEYDANPNNYDVVDYKCVKIDGSAESTTGADGKTVDPTDEEKAAALSTAKSTADTMRCVFPQRNRKIRGMQAAIQILRITRSKVEKLGW